MPQRVGMFCLTGAWDRVLLRRCLTHVDYHHGGTISIQVSLPSLKPLSTLTFDSHTTSTTAKVLFSMLLHAPTAGGARPHYRLHRSRSSSTKIMYIFRLSIVSDLGASAGGAVSSANIPLHGIILSSRRG